MVPGMTRHDASACPDPEMIAAYLDHRLSGPEGARVAQHLASCEDCYFVFTESAQMPVPAAARRELEAKLRGPAPWWRSRQAIWTAGTGLAAAASLVVAVGTGLRPWRPADPPELRALVVAVGPERLIEARLTGGFAHGPLRGPVRSGDPSAPSVPPDVRIAAAQIEKIATAHPSASTLRMLGLADLVTGEIERAVPILEEAAGMAGAEARTFSDLAAAYLARAARTADRQDLMKALAAAERALGSDPRLAEAWFNRAVALERLSNQQARDARLARDAWLEYLKVDATSVWASEARSHASALDAALAPPR
jgi:tetratricopeptide (TPR) repeat protein